MSDYQTWKQNTLGNHYDVDNSGDFDCVDVPKLRAVDLYGDWVSTIGYGNAKDLYNGASDTYFEKIANDPSNPDQLPIQGDIIVFSETPYAGYSNQYNNPYGHTGVVDSADSNGYTIISQSSGTGNPAQLHTSGWHFRHCIGWLRPKDLTPPPAPAPDPYTLTDIPEMKVIINRQTNRWNMGYSDLQQMKDNPVESLVTGAGPYTVSVLCHQNGSGYDYYLENRNNLGGFNVYDCAPYVEPIVLPADIPVPPRNWATAPIGAPSTALYPVLKLIDGYDNSNRAANHIEPATAPVGAGDYYIYSRRFADNDSTKLVAINVTQTLGQPGYWINPDDNVLDSTPEPVSEPVPPVEPPPLTDWTYHPNPVEVPIPTITPELTPKGNVINPNWRSSYRPFKTPGGQNYTIDYEAMQDFTMHDLETAHKDVPVKSGQRIVMAGHFVGPDDVLYGMPLESRYDAVGNLRYWFYGCPLDKSIVMKESELYDITPLTKLEKFAQAQIHDIEARQHKADLEARNVIARNNLRISDNVIQTVVQVETFGRKFMDFFTGRRKKQ